METHFIGRERGGRGNQSDAEVLAVCHRPGCAVPDAGCARTLIGQSALRRHVEASGKEPRWLSDVRPVKFRGFDDSTQHSQEAVELEFDLEETVIRFVAHVVPGNSGLLLKPFRFESPRSHDRFEKRSVTHGESEDDPGTLHDTGWPLRN